MPMPRTARRTPSAALTRQGPRRRRRPPAGRWRRWGWSSTPASPAPKVRARDTAALACKELGIEPEEDTRLEGGPFDPREVADGRGEHVLLVGHDPDFSLAVNHMTGAQVRMKKGGLAAVDRGELMMLLRPRELALLARAG